MSFQLPVINHPSNLVRKQSHSRTSFERFQPAKWLQPDELNVSAGSGHRRSTSFNINPLQSTGVLSPRVMQRDINHGISSYPLEDLRFQNINQQQGSLSSRRSFPVQGRDQDHSLTKASLLTSSLHQNSPSAYSHSYSPTNFSTSQFDSINSEPAFNPTKVSPLQQARDLVIQEQEGFGALFANYRRKPSIFLTETIGSPKSNQRLSLLGMGDPRKSPTEKRTSIVLEDGPKREEEEFDSLSRFLKQHCHPIQDKQESNVVRNSSFGNELVQAIFKSRREHESKRFNRDQSHEDHSETSSGYCSDNDLHSPKSDLGGNTTLHTLKSERKRSSGFSVLHKKSIFSSNEGLQRKDVEYQASSKKSSFRLERPNEQEQIPQEQIQEEKRQQPAERKSNWRIQKQRANTMMAPQSSQKEEKIGALKISNDQERTRKPDTQVANMLVFEDDNQKDVLSVKRKNIKERKITKVLDNKLSRKDRIHKEIKTIMWTMLFVPLYFADKRKRRLAQKSYMEENVASKIPNIISELRSFIIKYAGKEILALLLNKQNDLIFVSTKVLPEKRLDKDLLSLKEQLQITFSILMENLSSLSKDVLKFFAAISTNNVLLPNFYFSEFELNRLQCGYFGNLRDVTTGQANMIFGGIFIIRVLIHQIIMQPWNAFNLSQEKFDLERLFNIGSVLYNIAMEHFSSTTNLVEFQSLTPAVSKIRPVKKSLVALGNLVLEDPFIVQCNIARDGEVIVGFYSKYQLRCLFSERKKSVQEITQKLQELLNAFRNRVCDRKTFL